MRKGQVTQQSAAMLVIILVFALLITYLFLIPLVNVVVNVVILYFVFLRFNAQIRKHGKRTESVFSLLSAFFLLLLIGNPLPLWWTTTLCLASAIFLAFFSWMSG